MLEKWNVGIMEWWNNGMVERWNVGKMEWWKDGMVEKWKDGMMESRSIELFIINLTLNT